MQLIQQQFPEPPVKVDPRPDKAQGYHVKEMVGVVMMPDKNLSAEAIDKATDKEVPVAVLATKSLTLEDKDLMGHLMMIAGQIAQQEKIQDQGFRVVVNTGGDGGQSVFHIHLHVMGGRRMNWPPG